MAKFNELNSNLMDVLLKLISSQNLCKLLTYSSSDPLNEDDISDTTSLLFNKIFPTPRLPDTAEDVQNTKGSLLTVVIDDVYLNSSNGKFKDCTICFNIYCHIDLWSLTGTGKLRPYSIMQEIDDLFNEQRVVGIGSMQFLRSRFIVANSKNLGYKIDYKIVDFN